jgi:TonB family protein
MNVRKASKLLSKAILLIGISTSNAQQPAATPSSPIQKNGQQAIAVVLSHYGLDPNILVLQTHKPLPADGNWAASSNASANCPKTSDPCLRLTYRVPTSNVVCEWTVLLAQTVDKSLVLDMNEDAARYFSYKNLSDPYDHPVVRSTYTKPPIYPFGAKSLHRQGTVKMLAHIDINGHVDDVIYISGPEELRAAAMDAVREWKFSPLLIEGTPLPVRILEQVTFRMGS